MEIPELDNLITTRVMSIPSTVVIAYKQLEIGAINQLWLSQHGILPEHESILSSAFSAEVAIVQANTFHLTILPERLQLAITFPNTPTASQLNDQIIGGLLKSIPDTDFIALGFNFSAYIPVGDVDDFPKWNRDVFSTPRMNSLPFLAQPDARFGQYCSFDANGYRVRTHFNPTRLSVRPAEGYPPDTPPPFPPNSEIMQVTTNFNLFSKDREDVRARVGDWDRSREIFNRLVVHFL